MKKLLKLSLIFVLSICCMFTLFGCGNTNENNSSEATTGLVCDVKTDEEGKDYAIVEKFTLSEADALKVASGDYADLMQELTLNEYTENGVTYPIKEIEAGAFTNQLVLKKVIIGANVEKIGNACFAGCANLEELVVNFVGEEADSLNSAKTICHLFGTSSFTNSIAVSNTFTAGATASTYYLPEKLSKIEVTGNVIPAYAFNGVLVKEIVLSGNVEYIGEGAFSGMTNLNKFTFPASVKEIGKQAFSNCYSLYSLDFSKATSLTTIWQEAFSGCSMLGFGSNVVSLPSSVNKIYSGAFRGCTNLKSIDLTNTQITEIPTACFFGCEKLVEVKYNTGVIVGNDASPENN